MREEAENKAKSKIGNKAEKEPLARREFLRRGAFAGAGLSLALLPMTGCGRVRDEMRRVTGPAEATWTPLPHDANKAGQAVHVLNRVAYGPCPGDVARVANMGAGAYLEEQIADRMDENPTVTWRVNGLDAHQTEQDAPDTLYDMDDGQLLRETEQAAILRAVYGRHQLREIMADFWTNHFNIYALKNDGRALIPTDTERVLRPHALGRFADLLRASAHSPAMLAYLDNNQNRKRSPTGNENANENYARELLELHTLGVRSGYTQRDIQEVARCFTGWTVTTGWRRGQYAFDMGRHDEGGKYIPFLNLTITPNGGERDAQTVLERLAAHPTTARFVARKLCRRFLGDAPDRVVTSAANAYLQSGGDIRATLRPILLDALVAPAVCKPILKRPLDYIASSLRALAADTDGGANVQKHLSDMGQPLYQWPMPDGFPDKASSWTGSLLPRWNFALALCANKIDGTRTDLNAPLRAAHAVVDADQLDTLLETVYGRPRDTSELASVRAQLRTHIERARRDGLPPDALLSETAALLLAAPAFQWK